MDALNDVYSLATRAGSLRTQQEVRQSSQTRQQLTSLLSAVQASLAELKVEVASARQLSCDATPPSVTKISRSASPGCHGTLIRCLSPTIGSQLSPDSSSVRTRDVDLLQVHHTVLSTWPPSIGKHHDAAGQLQNMDSTGISAVDQNGYVATYKAECCPQEAADDVASRRFKCKLELEVKQNGDASADKAANPVGMGDLRAAMPQRLMMLERDLDSQASRMHALSQSKPSLPAELPHIACPTQPPTAVEGDSSSAQPESREHGRQSQAHAHSLQRTVQELSLATQGVRQDAVDLADCLAHLGELREDVATLKNEMQLFQLNVQGSQVPKIFELLHKSDVERQAMRQQIVALHEAMKTAPKHDALCEAVQACCMQVTAMQADLSSSQTSVQQVCALEQSMEQLQQYVQTDRAPPCKEQTDMACRFKTQLQEMQTSQSAMQTANQQSLAESNRRIMEVQQIAERALDMSSAHPMAQRLELTNKQLTGVSKSTQELLQMHAATVEQLQNLTEKVELGSVQDKVTTIVATLQQHVDNLHSELQQSVDAQQASIQETNMRLKLVVEAHACTQQELLMLRGDLGTVCQELWTKQEIGMRCEMSKVDNLNRVHEDGQMFNHVNMPVISKGAVHAQDSLCLTETATTLVTAVKRLQQCNYDAATVRQAVSDKEDEHTQPSVASNMLDKFAAAAERMDGMEFAVETLSIAIVNCQDSIKTLSLQFLGCHQDGTCNSKAESSESQRGLEQQASLTSQTVAELNTECYSGHADPAGASQSSCKVENMSTELKTDGATTQWKPTQTGSQGLESSGVKTKISKHADVGQLAERVDSIKEAQLAEICEIDVLKGEVDVISSNMQLRADACSEMSEAIEKLQRATGLQEQRINGIEKDVALLQDTSEARSCDSDCGNQIADLTQQLDLVGERLKNVLDDIDNQQQRAEHHQRNNDTQFAQLSMKVQQSMAEILVLRSSESGTHGGSKAVDPAIFNDEQATQLKQTMKQVSGADEKLSALSEMLVNNRAETAELREVLRALRSGQHQLADDLPSIQIALEERLNMLEERAPHAMDLRQLDAFVEQITNLSTSVDELRANVQNLESTFQSMEADRASSRNLMPIFNESDQEVTQPWQIELETRVGHIEESITLIQRCTQQFTDTQMDNQHLHEKASEDRVDMSNALNKIQVNMDRLQHEVEQMRVIEQQQSELTETVSRLEGHVKVMDSRIEDSAKLNELAVDKSTLDSLLAEVETAMDDIANEMDELKASCQHPVATVIPQVDMLTDQLKKQEQQIKKITHDFDEFRVVIGDGSLKEMHLQLEALGQRFRGLADDVEELEVGLRDQKVQMKSSPLTPLPKHIQRLHESTADIEVQHCEGCADGQEKLRGEVALPSAQLFARAKGVLTNGEPVVMMQYMCPNAHHMVSIETTESQSAGCSPDRSVDGQWAPPSKADCDSSLSSIEGDLRVMPVHMPGISPSNMQTNDLFVHHTPDEAEVSNTGTMLA